MPRREFKDVDKLTFLLLNNIISFCLNMHISRFKKIIIGAKGLNEHICGFSVKIVEKLQTKILKGNFCSSLPIHSVSKVTNCRSF